MDEYSDLLRNRKIWNEGSLDVGEIINNARILLYHQNLADLLEEAHTHVAEKERQYPLLADKHASESCSQVIEVISSFIKESADLQGCKVDQVATLSCIETLNRVINNYKFTGFGDKYFKYKLEQENRNLIQNLITVMCKLFYSGNLDLKSFVKMYCKMKNVPLELIWHFQESGLTEANTYIINNLYHPQEISKITTCMSVAICSGGGDDVSEKIAVGILSPLIGAIYGTGGGTVSTEMLSSHKAGLKIVLSSILHKVNDQLLQVPKKDKGLVTDKEDAEIKNNAPNPVDIYNLLASSSLFDGPNSQVIQAFFSSQLAETLKFSPDTTLNQAFSRQKDWSYSKSPQHLQKILTSLIAPFDAKDALDVIQKVLKGDEVNWRIVLTSLSVYVVTKDKDGVLMKEFVSSLVHEAFTNSCRDSLILALLTARQCGAEGCGFPPYTDWFNSTFGSRGTWGNTADAGRVSIHSFRFLMTLITELVPVESVLGLRAHISFPPQTPPSSSARGILSDYLHLAKTRLTDFGVTVGDQGGLFRSNQMVGESSGFSSNKLVESEVEVVLSHFEKTGTILKTVLEASVFRKRYLEQTFLPELLKPRPLPDEPDTRMKFIETLCSKGLISADMLSNYLTMCKEESEKIQRGGINQSDEQQDGLLLLNHELQKHLNFLQNLQDMEEKLFNQDAWKQVKDSLSAINRCIDNALDSYPVYSEENNPFIENSHSIISRSFTSQPSAYSHKIMDAIIETIMKGLQMFSCSNRMQWLYLILDLLKPKLQFSLYNNLFDICIRPSRQINHEVIACAAAVIFCLHTKDLNFPSITVEDTNDNMGSQEIFSPTNHQITFLTFLSMNLPMSCQHDMECTIQLCEFFLYDIEKYVLSVEDMESVSSIVSSIPNILISKYLFLLKRYQHARINYPTQMEFDISQNPEIWCSVWNDAEVSVNQWLAWELEIDPVLDIFDSVLSRKNYNLNCLLKFATKNPTCKVLSVTVAVMDSLVSTSDIDKDSLAYGSSESILFSSFQEFLIYKQECIICNKSEHNASTIPWILDYWIKIKRSENVSSSIKVNDNTDWKFLSLWCILPPWLILKNTPKGKVLESVKETIVILINKHLKESLCDEAFLPLSFILHLLVGIVEYDSEPETTINYLIKFCPSFKLALLVHHVQLKPVFQRLRDYSHLKEFYCILKILGSVGDDGKLSISKTTQDYSWEVALVYWAFRKAHSTYMSMVISESTLEEVPQQLSGWLLFYEVLSLGWTQLFSKKSVMPSQLSTLNLVLSQQPVLVKSLDILGLSKLSNTGPHEFLSSLGNAALAFSTCKLLTNFLQQYMPDKQEKDKLILFLQALLSARVSWSKLSEKYKLNYQLDEDKNIRTILSQAVRMSRSRNESPLQDLPEEYMYGLDSCITEGIFKRSGMN